MKYLSFLLFSALSFAAFANEELADLSNQELKAALNRITGTDYVSLNYKQARIKLFNEIYLEKDEKGYFNRDVYCNARFDRTFKTEAPNDELPNANNFNTEHTWPQSKFNESLNEEVQKTDLHHLFPTLNRINGERGNYPFANVGVLSPKKISCDVSKLGQPMGYGKGTFFEPPTEHKGNVARAMFYFSIRYELPIDAIQEISLKFWHMLDPVDEKEKERHEIIAGIQKNRNPFIDDPELVLRIADF